MARRKASAEQAELPVGNSKPELKVVEAPEVKAAKRKANKKDRQAKSWLRLNKLIENYQPQLVAAGEVMMPAFATVGGQVLSCSSCSAFSTSGKFCAECGNSLAEKPRIAQLPPLPPADAFEIYRAVTAEKYKKSLTTTNRQKIKQWRQTSRPIRAVVGTLDRSKKSTGGALLLDGHVVQVFHFGEGESCRPFFTAGIALAEDTGRVFVPVCERPYPRVGGKRFNAVSALEKAVGVAQTEYASLGYPTGMPLVFAAEWLAYTGVGGRQAREAHEAYEKARAAEVAPEFSGQPDVDAAICMGVDFACRSGLVLTEIPEVHRRLVPAT